MPACACPVTKTLNVFYQVSDPPATANHQVKWRVVGDTDYTIVSPNPTPILVSAPDSYKVEIPNVPACQDVEVAIQRQCPNNQNSTIQTNIAPATVSYGCTQTVSGTRTGSALYTYPEVLLDFTNAPGSFVINYNVNDPNNPGASNPPNRFRIKDTSGNTVFDSNWKGVANYAGPWLGDTLNTSTSGTLSFTKVAGSCFYTLIVDTFSSGDQTDNWSLSFDCTTDVVPPVDPTITLDPEVGCNNGVGRYIISSTAGTIIKLGIATSGTLSNNNGPSNCARIDAAMTASTGPTISAVSGLVSTTATASVGGSNSVFITLTIPASGYIVVDTEVIFKNSGVSGTATAAITIFEVNGVAKNITRSICIGSQTVTIPCEVVPPCTCPSGYTASPDGTNCIKEQTVAATAPTLPSTSATLISETNRIAYTNNGTILYTSGYNASTGIPLGGNTFSQDLAANRIVLLSTPFWKNTLALDTSGPLNRTGVWISGKTNYQTIGFSTCINITQAKTYLVGVGCDNYSDIKLNGVSILNQDLPELEGYYNTDTAPFSFWHIYPINLPAGNNVLQVSGTNITGDAGLGVEIYDASFADIIAATSYTDLGAKLIFSTKNLIGTVVSFATGGSGYTCPTGYVLKTCGLATPICYKVSYVNCEPAASIQYSLYNADVYNCAGDRVNPSATNVLVAFPTTFSPVINNFYFPLNRNGSVYKIKSTSTSTEAGFIMSNIGRSTVAAICELSIDCYFVSVPDIGATVTVQYVNPVTGLSAQKVFTNAQVVETLSTTTPFILSGNGLLTGPQQCNTGGVSES